MTTFPIFLEQINFYLFHLINASNTANIYAIKIGIFFANYAIIFFPMMLLLNWFLCGKKQKKAVISAIFSMQLALLINFMLGIIWQHPRPFMIPIGQQYIYHVANNSFPSNHMSITCAISINYIIRGILYRQGFALLALSFIIAWGRIYTGIHFPLDMIASFLVALFSSVLSLSCIRIVNIVYTYTYLVYKNLFSIGIKKGIIK